MTEFLMTFLLNAFWQTAVIVLGAIIGTWLLRDAGSRSKYVVWVAALTMSLTLPILTAGWFNGHDLIGRSETMAVSELRFEQVGGVVFEPSVSEAPIATAVPSTIPIGSVLAFGILAIYGLFVVYRAGSLLNALLRTVAIRRRAKAGKLPKPILAAIDQCRGVLSGPVAEVLFSTEVSVPVTIGCRRPVIILPEGFINETDTNVLTTAVGHEMIHIARRDYAVNLLFEIVSLPISFHPAVAYAKRRIAQIRELCCDEVVASRLLNADIYARSLLNIAGSATPVNRLSPMITVGITDNRNLEVRIMSLLKRSEMSRFKKGLLALAALAVLAVPLVVAAYLSPDVTITSTAVAPEAQPTPPDNVDTNDKMQREEWEKELAEIKVKLADPNLSPERRAELRRHAETVEGELRALETKERVVLADRRLKELVTALQDPSLSEGRRSELRALAAKVKEELSDLGVEELSIEQRAQRLKDELGKVVRTLEIPSLNEAQKYELRSLEAKLRSELSLLETGRLRPIVVGIRGPGDDDNEWDYPRDMDADMDTPRSRNAMEMLRKAARLTMEEAAELALASVPGKLIDKHLGQIRGEPVYRFYIIDAAATPDSNSLQVDVSGMDGRIIKSARTHVTTSFDSKHPGEKVTKNGKKPE